ncbi:thiol-disulfide oxidoreductase DCC family protein [Alicyclobacillus sp. ALC3]|nr:thiol-disulfide oxidoreductase DCC family protein [Alicyclobacillus sp. ALC3]
MEEGAVAGTSENPLADPLAGPILLFDGVCNLCNAAVQFVVRRDPSGRVRFAPLQSAAAAELLDCRAGVPGVAQAGVARGDGADGEWNSVVCIDQGHVYTKSDAVLRVARYLRRPWSLVGWLRVVPRPFRDAIYDAIAKRRYRWFGRRTTCMVPDQSLKRRFLE